MGGGGGAAAADGGGGGDGGLGIGSTGGGAGISCPLIMDAIPNGRIQIGFSRSTQRCQYDLHKKFEIEAIES